jgi:hypothetical protein
LDKFSKYDRFSLKVCWIYSEFIGFLLLLEVMYLYLQFEIVSFMQSIIMQPGYFSFSAV